MFEQLNEFNTYFIRTLNVYYSETRNLSKRLSSINLEKSIYIYIPKSMNDTKKCSKQKFYIKGDIPILSSI